MKKIPGSILAVLLLHTAAFGQDDENIQGPTFAVHFFFNDFKSASAIRTNSLGIVFKNHEFGKIKDMHPGIAVSYIDGLTKYFDISACLAGSFLDFPMQNRPAFGSDKLLLEGDVSVRGKLVSNKYIVQPYLQAGIGGAKYRGYWAAFIPFGAGIQLNLFDEAYLLSNIQYRIPVTETSNYHFFYSLGLAGKIGDKKK